MAGRQDTIDIDNVIKECSSLSSRNKTIHSLITSYNYLISVSNKLPFEEQEKSYYVDTLRKISQMRLCSESFYQEVANICTLLSNLRWRMIVGS